MLIPTDEVVGDPVPVEGKSQGATSTPTGKFPPEKHSQRSTKEQAPISTSSKRFPSHRQYECVPTDVTDTEGATTTEGDRGEPTAPTETTIATNPTVTPELLPLTAETGEHFVYPNFVASSDALRTARAMDELGASDRAWGRQTIRAFPKRTDADTTGATELEVGGPCIRKEVTFLHAFRRARPGGG